MKSTSKLESYGMIGDLHTAALISEHGSLNWLCWPAFDSPACFASLLGKAAHGLWLVRPQTIQKTERRYIPHTLILATTYRQSNGAVIVATDFMPLRKKQSAVIRIVKSMKGHSHMKAIFSPRFYYGSEKPRIEMKEKDRWSVVSGPHRLTLQTDAPLRLAEGNLAADWSLKEGDVCSFSLQYSNSYSDEVPDRVDPEALLKETLDLWEAWSARNVYRGSYREQVERSLITLKALTYAPSGGFVAAPTTSLPEKIGGIRNWDYRFCWLRDSTFNVQGLLECGFKEEARAWLNWLSRSVRGDATQLKIMYGMTGQRENNTEWVADWLTGYARSTPVHIGNGASSQFQLDTFGEVLDTLYRARHEGLYPLQDKSGVALEVPLLRRLEKIWSGPDEGLWEFRTGPQQFTHSKAMAWVAFDRGIRMVEEFGMEGPVAQWRKLREKIHKEVCQKGFHKKLNSFTQSYGSSHLDSSVLLMPIVGFLPIDDERITGTVHAIEKHLMHRGLLLRYDTRKVKDGLPPGEGAFLACNFWLIDVYLLQGRLEEAKNHFERLLSICNPVGLLSEEYDAKHGLLGNFPQAFSHIGLINAALSLDAGTSLRLRQLNRRSASRHKKQ